MPAIRALLAVAAMVGGVLTGGHPAGSPAGPWSRLTSPQQATGADRLAQVPETKLLGQRIMVGMDGTFPSPSLLRAVRQGRVGSVILFTSNIVSRAQLRALTGALQAAASRGGNPRLLIATDQEGGQIKRLAQGPPNLSPPQIDAAGSAALAFREGLSTGRYLKGLGINWDLAPVLDVPTFSGAFIWAQGRAFSFRPQRVAREGTEFALGLQRAGAAASGKHFPGLGSAAVSTDNQRDELRPSRAQRAAALVPYREATARGMETVMLSTAGFPALDPSGAPAALSARIARGLLRGRLHFGGVSVTDALGSSTGHNETTAGVLAARAGADVLLYTDAAPGVLDALRGAMHAGRLSRADSEAAYGRITALKRRVAGG